jgi:beta-glucosidase
MGTRAGEEVVQLYIRDKEASVPVPLRSLQGFRRILLNPGESRTVVFPITPAQMALWDEHMRQTVEVGTFEIAVGGGQPGGGGAAIASAVPVLIGEVAVATNRRGA